MSGNTSPSRGRHGIVIPGHVSKRATDLDIMPGIANGLHIRGVVVNTRVYDDQSILGKDEATPLAVYCDVVGYSTARGLKFCYLNNCVVLQPRSGIHDGDIWIPHATTMDVTGGNATDPDSANVMNWDGDHVLVTFIDDNLSTPVIVGSVPHPNADLGKSDNDLLGERLRIRTGDGQPRLMKHHGVQVGITSAGNVLLDTRRAHDGTLQPNGFEPEPTVNGDAGNVDIFIQSGATLTINGPNEQFITIDDDGSMTLGNGETQILINASGSIEMGEDVATKRGIARLNDTIQSSSTSGPDPAYWQWAAAVDVALRALAGVSGAIDSPLGAAVAAIGTTFTTTAGPPPTSLTGEITSASSVNSVE